MINREKERRIENFLIQEYSKIGYENYNLENLTNIIYNSLRRFEMNEDCESYSNNNMFFDWINRFKNKDNIRVFNSREHSYFCQFENEKYNKQVIEESDPIKMYVSVSNNHLYKTANLIFDFCCDNNIIHVSKISKQMRNDVIVLRVKDINDANKLLKFINSNDYIVKEHNKANPFCFNCGIVGLALDNKESYNYETSSYVAKYLLDCKKKKNNVSANDFTIFVRNFYQTIENKKEIKDLLYKSLTDDSLQNFSDHFYSVVGNKHLLKNKKQQDKDDDKMITNIMNLIEQIYEITKENHGEIAATNSLLSYLKTGNTGGFSRYQKGVSNINYREFLMQYNSETVKSIFCSVMGYIDINDAVKKYIHNDENHKFNSI